MQEYLRLLLDRSAGHWGKIAGTAFGLLFGWLSVRYGILQAIFVSFCLAAGYAVGARWDQGGFRLGDWLRRIPGRRRRW